MRIKIAAAFLFPILVTALVFGVLKAANRTAVPPLSLPDVPTGSYTSASGSTTTLNSGPCFGVIPEHFAGLAIKGGIGTQVTTFAQVTGHAPQVVEFYNPFKKPFANFQALQVIKAGEIPLIQLNPKGVSLRGIAEGNYDYLIKSYAIAVKKFGCAIMLSFGHEMNGWWYPWGTRYVSPSDYIAACRHIHNVFDAEGVPNVIWSWDPSHQYSEVAVGKVATPASEWYPGGKYVDVIGLDGYLGYDRNGHPQSFREIFGFQLRDIRRIAPGKMVYIAETGVAPGPAARRQIMELFSGIRAHDLAGLVWFDATGQPDSTGKPKEYQLQKKPTEARVYKSQLGDFLR
jgi:mannan endo-1,4-beta-mannosidase